MTTPTPRNTPIEQLLKEYEAEGCNHANTQGVIDTAFLYVDSMPDSQVRCLLYVLARDLSAALERAERAEGQAEKNARDAERLDWLIDHGIDEGGGRGFEFRVYIPHDSECLREAIDAAIAGEKK